jgi:nitrate reductase delta subunit
VRRLTAEQQALAWRCAGLLLDYPDERLVDDLRPIREAAGSLPAEVADPLRDTVLRLRGVPLTELQADYVDTFDSRRRHNLFLTYFAHGDTRKRGMALLRFKQAYLGAGFSVSDEELPDHLCVVLEFGATIDLAAGRRLVLDHRAGLELLRLSLADAGSRWAGAVQAVSATLPVLRGDEMDAVRRLAAQGPPEEEVGLTPYDRPGVTPGAARSRTPVALAMPSFPGAR